MSASNILINNLTAVYGDNAVAGLGVAQRIFTLVILVFIGLSQGLQPFVGYNFASKNYKRMNAAIKISCIVSAAIGFLLLGLSLIFGRLAVAVFINNEEVIDYGIKFLVASYLIAPIIGFQFIFMSTFQALGKPIPSLILSISRQGIAFVPTILIGTKLFGVNGIIWAQPIADIVTVLIAAIMYIYIYRKMKREALKQEKNKESKKSKEEKSKENDNKQNNSEPLYINI